MPPSTSWLNPVSPSLLQKWIDNLHLTDKYPEISVNTKGSVDVASGEGQIPKDIMTEMTIGI